MTASTNEAFQPMPELSEEQAEALRDDITKNGILVPITVDQHGRIIDGNNRFAIAAELGIECPRRVVNVDDDDHGHDLAVTLNCARRHLTQEQKRSLIRSELVRRWSDSDRAVSRRIGCSPTTVGAVRAEIVDEAERRTRQVQDKLKTATVELFGACHSLLLLGADPEVILEQLRTQREAVAEQARTTAGQTVGGVSAQPPGEATVERIARLVGTHAMFSAVINDLTEVVDEVRANGVEWPLPLRIERGELDALISSVCSRLGVEAGRQIVEQDADMLSNLDARAAEAVVA